MELIKLFVFISAILSVLSGLSGYAADQARPITADQGEGWTNEPVPLIWESAYTQSPPTIDGKLDAIWHSAKPVTVRVREAMGGDHPKPVVLRALHTDDTFYMIAQWDDTTKSDLRDPYVWNPQTEEYERPTRPDDQFAIEFPIKGDFGISMLTVMREFTADVWHWKAGRGNLLGWVDDKYHVISQNPDSGGKKHDLHGGRSVYILRKQDMGTSAYHLRAAPTEKLDDVVDSFVQQKPTGSLADIRGKGLHDGKGWTLEMSRKFNTTNPDDAVIDPTGYNLCAIAVLNDELYEEHSVSTIITLSFVGGSKHRKRLLWNFDHTNEIPSGWKVEATNPKGKLAQWQALSDQDAPSRSNVLSITQIHDISRGVFNLCWTPQIAFQDGVIKVKVRANTGKIDQGGGPIWRTKDANNYYIARWNPLEDNFRVYFVKNAQRKQLGSAQVKADPSIWHEIEIAHKGNRIIAKFDGKKLIELEDATFSEAGGVGVWTKADAATSFDDFSIRSKGGQ